MLWKSRSIFIFLFALYGVLHRFTARGYSGIYLMTALVAFVGDSDLLISGLGSNIRKIFDPTIIIGPTFELKQRLCFL